MKKLQDYIITTIDNRGKNPKQYYEDEKHPVIDNVLIKNALYPDMKAVARYIDQDTFDNFLRGYVHKNMPLITLVGNGIGNVTLAPSDEVAIVQNTIGFVVNEELDEIFLYYYLKYNQERIRGFNRGSGQPSIKKTDILSMEVDFPDILIQKKIVNALMGIDEKIEINNAINRNLSEQAKAIFEHELLKFKNVPEGWTQGSLIDIADYLNGLAMQKFRPADEEEGIPVLKIKELRQGFCDTSSEMCSPSIKTEYIIHDGDVIFSWSGSLLVDFWCGGKCGLNQHLFKVTSDRYDKWFYYSWTLYHLDRFAAVAADKATTMGHIKRDELVKAEVLIPRKSDYERIGSIMAPIYDTIISNRIMNRKLAALRDELLPQLMSGEINFLEG